MTIWVDASAGASGDMLLGALVGAGVPVDVLQRAVDAIAPEPVKLRVEQVTRSGFAATRCHVEVADSVHHRTWRDIEALLERRRPRRAGSRASRCASSSGSPAPRPRAHGNDPADVHFHEVGALDAIADVVGASAGFVHLAATEVVVSPVAVGSGHVRGAHGTLPVPPPAVAELLRGVPSYAGPPGAPAMELCTPTGAALLTTVATSWGPQPAMTTDRDRHRRRRPRPRGARQRAPDPRRGDGDAARRRRRPLLLETNVDDLDPRVWPSVIAALLDAGASDAWLTPILMKKGRPAHTLSVLVAADRAAARARRRSSGTPPPSACASSRSPSTRSTATWTRSRSTASRSPSSSRTTTACSSTRSRSTTTSPARPPRSAGRSPTCSPPRSPPPTRSWRTAR